MIFNAQLRRNGIQVLILSLFAVGLNLLRINIAFGFDLLLGSCFSVLALLLLGDMGLLVGVSASLVIWTIHANSWSALMAMGELLWLWAYLRYFGDQGDCRGNGRIIIVDILYWFVIGAPAAFLLLGVFSSLDPAKVLLLVTGQALNGSISTTFGFSLYLLIRIALARADRSNAISIHGLTFATVMLSTILPGLIVASMSAGQLMQVSLQGQMERLEVIARQVTVAQGVGVSMIADYFHDSGTLIEFERGDQSQLPQRFQSNPGLFKALSQAHSPENDAMPQVRGLKLLTAKSSATSPNRLIHGYWWFDLAKASMDDEGVPGMAFGRTEVIVVEPARAVVQQLQTHSSRIMAILAWILMIAVVVAEMLAQLLARQFNLSNLRLIAQAECLEVPDQTRLQKFGLSLLWPLKGGWLHDLNQILGLLNERNDQINSLRHELQSTALKLETSRAKIDVLNPIDTLTGCFNKHELYRRLDFELQRCNRDRSDLSCLCIEVDHFNQIRDSYGLTMADQVLIDIVSEFQARVRTTDCLCRSGAAEFSLVLPMCSAPAAAGLAEQFRRAVETRVVTLADQQISVTISIGLSCLRLGNDDSESLINRAQNALYRAKIEGRNRSVTA